MSTSFYNTIITLMRCIFLTKLTVCRFSKMVKCVMTLIRVLLIGLSVVIVSIFVSLGHCRLHSADVSFHFAHFYRHIFSFELIDVEYMLVNKTDTANMTGQCRHICFYIVASVDEKKNRTVKTWKLVLLYFKCKDDFRAWFYNELQPFSSTIALKCCGLFLSDARARAHYCLLCFFFFPSCLSHSSKSYKIRF